MSSFTIGLVTDNLQKSDAKSGLADGLVIDFLQPQRPRQFVGPCNRRGMAVVVVVIIRSGTSRPDDQK